jgi:hypothetical protein
LNPHAQQTLAQLQQYFFQAGIDPVTARRQALAAI